MAILGSPRKLTVTYGPRQVKENAEKLKAKWESEATKTPGFWNFPENTAQARARVADAKVNPISVYARAVKEIDEKNIRDKSQK